MSAWKDIGEIGRSILKGSAVMVGTKRLATFADRAIPVMAGRSREAWERIKSTKSTGKDKEEKPLFEDDEEALVQPEESSQTDTCEDAGEKGES